MFSQRRFSMKLQSKFLLALLTVVSFNNFVIANSTESDEGKDEKEYYESRRRKVCRCCSLIVANNGSFGGNLTVGGSITAGAITGSSFALSPAAAVGTAGLPGVGGALAWGEVGNTTGGVSVTTGNIFPMNYSSASFSGIVETSTSTPATDGLRLTNAGIYLIFYQATQVTADIATQIRLTADAGASGIANSTVTVTTDDSSVAQVTGFVITSQPAGAFIQLQNSGATTITTPANPNVGAKITAIRIA